MDAEKRYSLITRAPVEEIVTEQELRTLLDTKQHPVAYDGFEPSGYAHLGSGLMRAQKINDLLTAGCRFKLFVADWHAWLNNKLGGDLERIQRAGNYLIKVWEALGVDTKRVEVVWASEFIEDKEYWKKVMLVAKHTTLARMARCSQIMGREEKDLQYTAQYFYPAMQAADVFQLGCDFTQLGMDQRKVYMLSREVGPKIGLWTPVVVSHHLLASLQGPQRMEMDIKMSKSKPDSAIFVHDSAEHVEEKIGKAFCPPKQVADNPILEICKYIIFRGEPGELTVERDKKYGGPVTFTTYQQLESAYSEGLHPLDLKRAVARELNRMLDPARKYFDKHPELLEPFKEGVTR
jgi:tyrosyl-tRNA synthetase